MVHFFAFSYLKCASCAHTSGSGYLLLIVLALVNGWNMIDWKRRGKWRLVKATH